MENASFEMTEMIAMNEEYGVSSDEMIAMNEEYGVSSDEMIAMNEEYGVSSDEMDEMTEDQESIDEMTEDQAKECGDFFDEMAKDIHNQYAVNSTNTTVFFCQKPDCSGTCGLSHGDLSPEKKAEIKQIMDNLMQERMAWRTMIREIIFGGQSEVAESPLPPSVPVRPEVAIAEIAESPLTPSVPVRPEIAQRPQPCRNFDNCSRLNCWFRHFGQTIQRPSVSRFPKQCKNGINCFESNCGFRHPGQMIQRSSVSIFPKECKNRNNCVESNCGFRHPGQSPP